MRRALIGSDRLGSGCLVLRTDTRENPGGKNGVMTWNTLEGPQSLQMYGNGEENVMNKKEMITQTSEVCKDNHYTLATKEIQLNPILT
jgi:hypothetical protein